MHNNNVSYEMSPCPVSFDHYNAAVKEFFEGDAFKATLLLRPFATYGDVFAQSLMGQYFYNKGEYESALNWYLPASREGEDRLTAYLEHASTNYWNFDGRSHEEVLKNIRESLTHEQIEFLLNRQGDDKAQFNLGLMHFHGKGVEQDSDQAFKWWSLASSKGNSGAQYNLGVLYEYGNGVEKDLSKSLELYALAAEQGDDKAKERRDILRVKALTPEMEEIYFKAKDEDIDAQIKLANWFSFDPQNPIKDYSFAFRCFGLAANQDNHVAQRFLGYMYQNGIGIDKNIKNAIHFYAKASQQGDVDSMIRLGKIYYSGDGVEQNYSTALEIFSVAADRGASEAQYHLGTLYLHGCGVENDLSKAFEFFTLAASQGHMYAKSDLGCMYQDGLGVTQNLEEAFTLFFEAAEAGISLGQFNLAECYEEGLGTDQDFTKAVTWYRKAADQNDPDALYRLGKLKISGSGCDKNESEGLELIRSSASQGHEDAISLLEKLESSLQREVPTTNDNTLDSQLSFAPLTRQTYSDTTWSGDSFVNEAMLNIASEVEQIVEMDAIQRGTHLGATVLHLRHLLMEFNEDPALVSGNQWRETYADTCISIDAHIAYNAIIQGVLYQVDWKEAVTKILGYAQANRLYDVFNSAKKQGDENPAMAVGIDFLEQVIADIID